jgi:hypothetical protein
MSRTLSLALGAVLALAPAPGLGDDPETEQSGPEQRRTMEETSVGFGIDLFSVSRQEDDTRIAVLDLGLLSVFELEDQDSDYFELEVLDLPLVTTFERRRDGERQSLRILNVPLFSLFKTEREGDERVETHFLQLPLIGALYSHERDEVGDRRDILYVIHLRGPGTSAPTP